MRKMALACLISSLWSGRKAARVERAGRAWYVEGEVKNLNDETTALALYRVWRADTGEWKAVRVTIV
jgi:hypothetical protein